MVDGKISKAAQQSLGLPEGFKSYSPFPFAGINLQSSGPAVADQEFLYLENFLRLGDGYLRTAWDVGTPLYVASGSLTIVCFFFYTIGTTYYVAVFLSDGSAVQVNVATAAVTTIGPAATFYTSSSGFLPGCSQWGVQYLLIVNRNSINDYWIWDGTTLYRNGTAAPNGVVILSGGLDYNTLPTVTAYGGGGTGLVVVPQIQGGSVVALNITNPGTGYGVGDVVQLAFSGGGSDTSAELISSLAAGGVAAINITAPGSGYTAATIAFSGGGGSGAAGTVTVDSGTGTVVGVVITSPGTGYTSAPGVVISGDGTGATGTALLAPGGVASVTVVNGGSGFTNPPLIQFVGGGGSGATGIAILTATSVARVDVVAGGTGYFHTPNLAFTGGGTSSGFSSGATATAHIAGGQLTSITVTNAGHNIVAGMQVTITPTGGDLANGAAGAAARVVLAGTSIASVQVSNAGQFYTDAPAVEVLPGANNAAYATVSLMPFGVSGASIETFQQRVWIADPAPALFGTLPPGGNFVVSTPESFIDFATSDGGDLFTNSDAFLQTRYVGIRQSNGYLYFFGDGSVAVVSNVQTGGSPATTTFNYQNVDPQSGLSWRDSRQDFRSLDHHLERARHLRPLWRLGHQDQSEARPAVQSGLISADCRRSDAHGRDRHAVQHQALLELEHGRRSRHRPDPQRHVHLEREGVGGHLADGEPGLHRLPKGRVEVHRLGDRRQDAVAAVSAALRELGQATRHQALRRRSAVPDQIGNGFVASGAGPFGGTCRRQLLGRFRRVGHCRAGLLGQVRAERNLRSALPAAELPGAAADLADLGRRHGSAIHHARSSPDDHQPGFRPEQSRDRVSRRGSGLLRSTNMARRPAALRRLDFESLIGRGENSQGFTAQTVVGTAHWKGTGWNREWDFGFNQPQVAPDATRPSGRSNRTGE